MRTLVSSIGARYGIRLVRSALLSSTSLVIELFATGIRAPGAVAQTSAKAVVPCSRNLRGRLTRAARTVRLVAAAAVLGASAVGTAQAQSATWGGTTNDYNTGTNWSAGAAPTTAGQSAVFANAGSTTVNVSSAITPGSWTFNTDTETYTFTGAGVNFGGTGIIDNAVAGSTISIANAITSASAIRTNGGTFTILGSASTTNDEGLKPQGGTINIGSATNATASLTGYDSGINTSASQALAVNNYGLIQGTHYEGVTYRGTSGLSLTNYGTGVIYGEGAAGAGSWGVGNDQGNGGALNIINMAGGQIVGSAYGVRGSVAGDTIVNAGKIEAGSYNGGAISIGGNDGVYLGAGGSVSNAYGALIEGNQRGITSSAGLTLNNLGTITGVGNDGVLVNSTSLVLNAGTISSNTNSGIAAGSGTLSVTNAAGGSLIGGSNAQYGYGLQSNGAAVTLNNYGSITGSAGGVTVFNGGSLIANLYAGSATGSIAATSGNNIVSIYTGTVNAAPIVTRYTDASGTNTVTLQSQGSVAAATVGDINLGSGTNTVNLRGAGDGSTSNGAVGSIANVIADSTAVNKLDSGTFVLGGANTYTGGTTISGGTLVVTNATPGTSSSIGMGDLTFDGGVLQAGADGLRFDNNIAINPTGGTIDHNGYGLMFTGEINGSGDLTIANTGAAGTGAVTLKSADNATGATNIGAGATLALAQNGSLSSSSKVAIGNGGTFDISNLGGGASITTLADIGATPSSSVALGTNTLTITNGLTTFSGVIADGGAGGALTIAGGTQTLAGINTYTGATTIAPGTANDTPTLALTGSGSVSSSSQVAVAAGGTFDISQTTSGTSITTLADSGARPGGSVVLGTKTLTITNGSTTFSGVIADGGLGNGTGGALTIAGGTQALAGVNTYTGATTIANGATLSLAGNGSIAASSGVTANGTFDVSNANTTITSLSGTGGVTLGAKTLTLSNASGSFGGVLSGTGGSLTLTTGTEILSGANTYTGGTTFAGGMLNVGSLGALGTAGTLSFTGGGLQYSAANQTDYSDRFSTASNQAYKIDTDGQAVTFAGVLASSGGSLTKLGTGTLSLSAANTFTGRTTISAGTLALAGSGSIATSSGVADYATFDISGTTGGVSIKSLSGSGTVALGSNSLSLTSATGTFSGTLGGTGGIILAGGTETFSGVNAYTGSTTLKTGSTLNVRADTNLGAATSALLFDGGTLGTTQSFTSARTATLEASGGTFAPSRNKTLTFGGSINGVGALTLDGRGTLVLSNPDNSYAEGTNLKRGTLSVGADAILGAGALTFNGGTLATTADFSTMRTVTLNTRGTFAPIASTTATFGGVIGGIGSLTMNGAGTLVLTAANTYSGGTTVSAGTLQIGNGGTTGSIVGDVSVVHGGTLVFDRSDVAVFTGNIFGTGGVIQSSSGTTVLVGSNTYSGATTINAGTLEVDGTLQSSSVTVNRGATLSGVGTIGDPTFMAGSTLSPGTPTSMGTMTFIDALTMQPGSNYNLRVAGGGNDSVNVTHNNAQVPQGATINGGNVVATAVGPIASRYRILTTEGGVTGRFDSVTSNAMFRAASLTYDPNNVDLLFGDPNFRLGAKTVNQYAVASGLNVAAVISPNAALIQTFGSFTVGQAQQAQAVLDSLSGEGITATQNLAHREAQMFNSAIFDQTTFYGSGGGNSITLTAPQPGSGFIALAPSDVKTVQPIRELADLPPTHVQPVAVAADRTWRAWGSGFGGTEDIHGNGVLGTATQNNQIYGGAVGVDYKINPNYLIGVAVGGSDGEFNVPNRATSGSTTGGHIAVYDIARFGAFYAASSTSASFYQNRTTRSVAGFGGLGSETERGNFSSHEFRSRLEFGRDFGSVYGTITPFIALEIAELRSNGFGEQTIAGAGLFALNVSGQSAADAPGFVGARFTSAMTLGNGMVFRPTIQAAYVHEFAPYRSQFASIASLPGATFLVDGARPGRNAAQVKAGGELAIGPRTAIFANFDGELSGVSQLYAGKGGLKYLW